VVAFLGLARARGVLATAFFAGASGCVPSGDLDGYSSGWGAGGGSAGVSSESEGEGGSVVIDPGSGGTSASDPAAADTTLDLPVLAPEPDSIDAGSNLVLGDAGSPPCSGADEVIDGERCYRFASSTSNWLGARQSCRQWGGRLIVVGSADEDQLLAEHMLDSTWIGLQDILTEGTFFWENGSDASYRNFAAGEPNDGNGSDCVEKRQSDSLWYDQPCSLSKPFACEKSVR
jgi:lectin-like protein